jgi:uncharacterized repeat protein (TIGR04076 family)
VKEYANDPALAPCTVFKDGDTFIMDTGNMPQGFCSWAFADIHRDIMAVRFGGDFPWIKQKKTSICSCTDGLRPVIFKVEQIDG